MMTYELSASAMRHVGLMRRGGHARAAVSPPFSLIRHQSPIIHLQPSISRRASRQGTRVRPQGRWLGATHRMRRWVPSRPPAELDATKRPSARHDRRTRGARPASALSFPQSREAPG